MTYHSKTNSSKQLDAFTRLRVALYQFRSPVKLLFLVISLIVTKVLLDYLINSGILARLDEPFDTIVGIFGVGKIHFVNYAVAVFLAIIILAIFAKPIDYHSAEKALRELGIPDKTGNNTPIFMLKRRYKHKSKIHQLIFLANGTVEDDFKANDNLKRLGSKMGCFITGIETFGRRNNKLRISYRKVEDNNVIKWNNSYLSEKDFELVLGQKYTGDFVYADFNKSAHLLIAGSTGSGKSVLLSSLLMQSLRKGANVVIAEFSKRGVDWTYWKNLKNCDVFTNPKAFSEFFHNEIATEVERRAKLLEKYGCKNISEYNTKVATGEIDGRKLGRIVMALDEAGQVYIPSQDKEREEFLKIVRSALNKLVAEYRFCGIHLIISTQVPSSSIFSQEIRYLTDLKICGVSTKLLSQMAIDSEEAASIKQKGRFCTNNGDNFRGFLFRESEALAEFKIG